MRQLSSIASVLVSRLRHTASVLATNLNPLQDVRKYRPERHYMRGPGPKWREKHSRQHVPSARGT
jgi:hypothetical protein